MTDVSRPTKTVLFDDSVAYAAILEALEDRGVDIEEFPPADRRRRNSSLLASAISEELAKCGVRVRTTETLFELGVDRAVLRAGDGARDGIEDVADALLDRLDEVIDSKEIQIQDEDHGSVFDVNLAAAVRVWNADVVVTNNENLLERQSVGGVAIITVDRWLALADSLIVESRRVT